MAGKTDRTGVQYAFKKLSGRANTSNIKSDAQEVIGSNIQVGTQTIFGQNVPTSGSRIDYQIYGNTAEYVVFTVAVITGTTYDADSATGGGGDGSQSAGPHGYKLFLTGNYEALSSNPKKGSSPFTDGSLVHESLGRLQLIPPNFSQESPNPYILKIYEADSGNANEIGDEIPLLDEVDWTFDYYNGILFLQDYDSGKIPAYARGFIYIGDYLSASIGGGGGGGDGSASYVVMSATGSLSAERVLTPGSGINVTDAGAGSTVTLSVHDSVVATISGSTFTGATKFNSGLSGSLTRLTGGTSYLAAGANVTITSASNGQITISSTGGGGGGDSGPTFFSSTTNRSIFTTGSTAFVGGQSSPAAPDAPSDIGNDVFFFVSGSIDSRGSAVTGSAVFGGDIAVSGSLHGLMGLSGSLTRLADGSSYLAAGSNITILSASNGQITISSTAGGGGSGDSAAHYVVTEATGSLSNYKLIEAGTGITLTTGSNSLTVASDLSLIQGRNKKRYIVTASHPADSPFSTPQSNFSQVVYDPDLIDVYLNGMLTLSGTSAQVDSAAVDYTVFSSGSISFAFSLNPYDVVDVVLSQLNSDSTSGGDASATYLVLSATGSLTNERVFTAGTGLSTTDGGAGNTYTVDVDDSVVATLTGSVFTGGVTVQGALTSSLGVGTLATNSSTIHISASNTPSSGSVLVAKSSTEAAWQQAIVFGEQPSGTKNGSNLTFALGNAVINNTDLMLFVNGLLQLSGSSSDYTLTGSVINFNNGLAPFSDDVITAIYRPSN